MIDRLLGLIAPHICCSCGDENAILCENCFFDIIEEPFSRCVECLKPTSGSDLCSGCASLLPVDGVWVVGTRRDAIKELIDLYKFEHNYEAATYIAKLLHMRLPQLPEGTVICYIPDIPQHRRQRGFDHMKLIATRFAKLRHSPVLPLLQRQTFYSQRGLTKRQRMVRQERAFMVEKAADIEHCLLLDDVYTTGATIKAGVAALHGAGIEHVYVGVVARQPLDEQTDL